MSNLQVSKPMDARALEQVLIKGDISGLSPAERLSYLSAVCDSLGLNPLTKPFEFIRLNGKETLYAKRDATDQLRKVHGISISITDERKIDDLYIVKAKAINSQDGREDEATGVVNLKGLNGDSLANAMMKAETKAKRRVTLSICGLGILDETEIETIVPEKAERTVAPKEEKPPVKNPLKPYPADYAATFGKFKNKKLSEVDMYELDNYLQWVKKSAEEKGKEITGNVKEFVDNAESYLATLETQDSIVDAAKASMDQDTLPF
jgi:hypothetical protein